MTEATASSGLLHNVWDVPKLIKQANLESAKDTEDEIGYKKGYLLSPPKRDIKVFPCYRIPCFPAPSVSGLQPVQQQEKGTFQTQ